MCSYIGLTGKRATSLSIQTICDPHGFHHPVAPGRQANCDSANRKHPGLDRRLPSDVNSLIDRGNNGRERSNRVCNVVRAMGEGETAQAVMI